MRARHKKKMRAKMTRYTPLRKGNIERLWYRRVSMWRDGERVYTWENSSPAMRERIIEKNRDFEVEDRDWWEDEYADAERAGIEITGHDDCFAYGHLIDGAMESIDKILEEHGEDCETFNIATQYRELLLADEVTRACTPEEFIDDCGDDPILVSGYLKAILKDYRRRLRDEFEYLTSDKCLIELFEGYDYEFNCEGEIL